MQNEEFEWDDAKAAANLRKHGYTFLFAAAAMADPDATERQDPNPYEDRWVKVCQLNGRLVAVSYTERNGRIRIISARKPTRPETREYFDERA